MRSLNFVLTCAAMAALSQSLQSNSSFAASEAPPIAEAGHPLTKAELPKLMALNQQQGQDRSINQVIGSSLGLSTPLILHQLFVTLDGSKLTFYPLKDTEGGYVFVAVHDTEAHIFRVDANLRLDRALIAKAGQTPIAMPILDAQQELQRTLIQWAVIVANVQLDNEKKP